MRTVSRPVVAIALSMHRISKLYEYFRNRMLSHTATAVAAEYCCSNLLQQAIAVLDLSSGQGVRGFNPPPPPSGASQPLKFIFNPQKIVKISEKYIADPYLIFPQIEY